MSRTGTEVPRTVQQSTATFPTILVPETEVLHKIAALQCQSILGNSISRDSQLS